VTLSTLAGRSPLASKSLDSPLKLAMLQGIRGSTKRKCGGDTSLVAVLWSTLCRGGGISVLSHQAWFLHPDLGWPWVILGGLGLAIASHYPALKTLWQPSPPADLSTSTSTEMSASATPDQAQGASTPLTDRRPLTDQSNTAPSVVATRQNPQSSNTPPTPGKSISFDISPPQRR
jgi:hypothetical protein